MPNIVVVGGQWGDEGKGKVVDLLSGAFDVVARWQGGPNAGHTVRVEGRTFSLHQIPTGVIHEAVTGVIGTGMVIDPPVLLEEMAHLEAAGFSLRGRLRISDRAHVILPVHRALDALREEALASGPIGTTRRGIGPAYAAKAARLGLRVSDLSDEAALAARIEVYLAAGVRAYLESMGEPVPNAAETAARYAEHGRAIAEYVGETSLWLNRRIREGARVLFEGAQGALLDLDLGTYPYVTSSSTVAAGFGAGLGVGPTAVSLAAGVFKAYATRVGRGPFPTELDNDIGSRIRERGREYGTTTGRPRRCGWFDGVAARYAATINGLGSAALTLFDVLDVFADIPICTAYRISGKETQDFPSDPRGLDRAEPVYEMLPGWRSDTTKARTMSELPANARRYVDRIEALLGCEVALVSVGPDRTQTILRPGGSFERLLGGSVVASTPPHHDQV